MYKINLKSYAIFTKNMINNTYFPMNCEILFSASTLMFETKIQKIPKIQVEDFQNFNR
jgi:hypothetical protein